MGKGSKPRPTDNAKFSESYSRIFGERENFTGRLYLTKEEETKKPTPEILFKGTGWASKRFTLQEKQRRAKEKNPFHTTLKDKREQAEENQLEQAEKLDKIRKQKTGQVSDV